MLPVHYWNLTTEKFYLNRIKLKKKEDMKHKNGNKRLKKVKFVSLSVIITIPFV